MDITDVRRAVLAFDSEMLNNRFDPREVAPVSANYGVSCGYNSIRISKITSVSNAYGRSKTNLANLRLVSGNRYKLTATIKDFSQSNLTGFIYIADSGGNIKVQTTQLSTVHAGDTLSLEFVYNPATMAELSFYMNRGMNVTQGTFIVYGDILINEMMT